jgi:hypothetical protein
MCVRRRSSWRLPSELRNFLESELYLLTLVDATVQGKRKREEHVCPLSMKCVAHPQCFSAALFSALEKEEEYNFK